MTKDVTTASPAQLSLVHERVDDLPVLVALLLRLRLPEILERHLCTHGHQRGLSNGWLATLWLVFILSQGDHAKYKVEPWVEKHLLTLQKLSGQSFEASEFNDDRLGVVLRRLGRPQTWAGIEQELWHSTVAVYQLEPRPQAVWLDATTASGHHEPQPGGLMQLGFSKDQRPDLAQLKLMAAVAQPLSHLMATEVHPGNAADDPLYVPMIERVRRIVGSGAMLYVGDSKMAALSTRAELVRGKEQYLVPLPLTGSTAESLPQWVEEALATEERLEVLFDEAGRRMGLGSERSRTLSTGEEPEELRWTERVLLVRSDAAAASATEALQRRLKQASEELFALTPAPGRGRRQIRQREALEQAIGEVLGRHRVEGLLDVRFELRRASAASSTSAARSARGGAASQDRYVVSAVLRREPAIAEQQRRAGWRAYATNAPRRHLPMNRAVELYRLGWAGEREFHLIKSFPLGISPLHVRDDEQIAGLTCLLTLGARLLTLIQLQAREALQREGATLEGLYEGNPRRATDKPTALRLLRAIAGAEVTLTRVDFGDRVVVHLTPLPPLLQRILQLLNLPTSIYESLVDSS